VKLTNWKDNLLKYIDDCKDKGFIWGQWDCLKFVNGAVKAQRNVGFADDWFGSYSTPRGAALNYARITRYGIYNDIIDGLDDRLSRCLLAEVGSIVAIKSEGEVLGYSLGVRVDKRSAFVGEKGLFLLFAEVNRCITWSVE
jgi:hypothetical protein